MGALSFIVADKNLTPLASLAAPITNVTSARLVLTELDQFSDSTATFGGDDRTAQLLMQPFNTLLAYEAGIGLVGIFAIQDPTTKIDANGNTITVTLTNITDQLSQYSVGLGATYATTMGEIVQQIGATSPTGETVNIYNPTDNVLIGYVTYSGTTVTVSDPQGFAARVFPGPQGTAALQNALNITVGYASTTATGIVVANAIGAIIGTYVPTNEVTGWSATMLDDGAAARSAAPVQWTSSTGNLTISGNNLRKNTGTSAFFDGTATAPTNQTITQLTNPLGANVQSDGGLSFYATNATTALLAGLTSPGTNSVSYGFLLAAGTPPVSGPTVGGWQVYENGSVISPASVNLTYQTGDSFEVRIDQSVPGTPQVKYYVRGGIVYVSSLPPILPYAPLAFIATPGGGLDNAIVTRTVLPSQTWWEARFDQATPLEALLQLAKQSGNHVRQGTQTTGKDAGGPARTLEYGLFGVQSGIRLMSAQGADVNAMAANPQVRVVTDLTYKRDSKQRGINTITPLGAQQAEGPVTIERCWRIVNDPSYPYYGKWGNVAGSVFPEYDATNYPIKRRVTRTNGWEYYVRDVKAYAALGMEVRGRYTDPQFTFVDATAANQEATARALYVATTAKLKWESQVLETMSVQTVGAFRPPRAGNKVVMDFRRIGSDSIGNFSVMDTAAVAALATPYVLKVERTYDASGATTDDWTLTNLGTQPSDSNAASSAASLRDLEQIKIASQNSTTFFTISDQGDVDASGTADHSVIVPVDIPIEAFRVKRVGIRVVFVPFRQQVQTAANQTQTFTITIPTTNVTINVPHDVQHDIGGGTHDGTGFVSDNANIGGMPLHFHQVPIYGGGTGANAWTPTQNTDDFNHTSKWTFVFSAQNVFRLTANNSGPGILETNGQMNRVSSPASIDLRPSAHPHVTKMNKAITVAAKLTGTIDQRSITANLPLHTHPITAALNDVSAPALAGIMIDSGDGTFVDRSAALVDVASNTVGPWANSFYIYDASAFMAGIGKAMRVKVYSLATTQNPTGLGHFKVFASVVIDYGGVGSQAFRN